MEVTTMVKVWHMSRDTHFIQAPYTPRGRELLVAMRDSLPEYKGRKIRDIIQAEPEKIDWGKEYKFG
jgi:hypothetical protein